MITIHNVSTGLVIYDGFEILPGTAFDVPDIELINVQNDANFVADLAAQPSPIYLTDSTQPGTFTGTSAVQVLQTTAGLIPHDHDAGYF